MRHDVEIVKRLSVLFEGYRCIPYHVNEFTLLVALVLSARTTQKALDGVTPALFRAASTPYQMVDLGEVEISSAISSLSLYRTKARYILRLSHTLIEKHDGAVPKSYGELIVLPGVGQKTANLVLSIAHGQATIAVDTHVFRVARRLGLAKGRSPDMVEQQLLATLPPALHRQAHDHLIALGRTSCQARRPKCGSCRMSDLCATAQGLQ